MQRYDTFSLNANENQPPLTVIPSVSIFLILDYKPLQIRENHVFVLSSNLSAKHDGRGVFGPISNSSILGVVWVLFRK